MTNQSLGKLNFDNCTSEFRLRTESASNKIQIIISKCFYLIILGKFWPPVIFVDSVELTEGKFDQLIIN